MESDGYRMEMVGQLYRDTKNRLALTSRHFSEIKPQQRPLVNSGRLLDDSLSLDYEAAAVKAISNRSLYKPSVVAVRCYSDSTDGQFYKNITDRVHTKEKNITKYKNNERKMAEQLECIDRDWILPETLVDILAKYENYRTSLLTLYNDHGLNYASVRKTIIAYCKTFNINGEIVELRPEITICSSHIDQEGCRNRVTCSELHLCPEYAAGTTEVCDEDPCPLGHMWTTDHNSRILQMFNIKTLRLNAPVLRDLLQFSTTNNPNPVGAIDVCQNYNLQCCGRKTCKNLHICSSFIANGAQCQRSDCTLNHDLTKPGVTKLLQAHGLPVNECPKDIVAAIIEAQPLLSTIGAADPKRATVWSLHENGNVKIPEICYSSVKGICKKKVDGCPRLHADQNFHYQVSAQGNIWMNLQPHQVSHLEHSYCDPMLDTAILPDLNPLATNPPVSSLKHLLGGDTWQVNFQSNWKPSTESPNLRVHTMSNSSEDKILLIRRLSTEGKNEDENARSFSWYYEDNDTWIEFGTADDNCNCTSVDIERAFRKSPLKSFHLELANSSFYLDYRLMILVDQRSNQEWKVRRRPRSHFGDRRPSNDISGLSQGLPPSWTPMPPDGQYSLVNLPSDSNEYIMMHRLLEEWHVNAQLKMVSRIQNPFLWRALQNKINELLLLYGEMETVNVSQLFHGTKEDVVNQICSQNFDWRLRSTDFGQRYGNGSYFTPDPNRALGYCEPNDKDELYMFVAQVVIGTIIEGGPDVIRPSTNPSTGRPFETTVDDMLNPSVFVKYDKQEYYPEYLLTLTVN